MASLYNDQIAFIHVPKTGGSWVSEALLAVAPDLRVPPESDNPAMGEHRYWDQMPAGRYSFGFVRHPATWYRSYFMFVKMKNLPPPAGDRLWAAAHETQDFRDFVERATTHLPGTLSSIYTRFIGNPGDVSFVGRYECLTEDLFRALAAGGVSFDPATIRSVRPVNESAPAKPPITPELWELICASEEATLERFGYSSDIEPALT